MNVMTTNTTTTALSIGKGVPLNNAGELEAALRVIWAGQHR